MTPQVRNSLASHAESTADQQQELSARAVLQELFKLLEEYAPTWYTEAHHDRIVAVLATHPGESR